MNKYNSRRVMESMIARRCVGVSGSARVERYTEEVIRQAAWVEEQLPDATLASGVVEDLPERVAVATPERAANDRCREQCKMIAEVAADTDSCATLAQKTGITKPSVGRRLRAMERELGIDPATPAEKATARFQVTSRRAGAIARRWRRQCL